MFEHSRCQRSNYVKEGILDYLIGGLYHEKTDKLFVVGGTNTGIIHIMSCMTSGLVHVTSLHEGMLLQSGPSVGICRMILC